MPTGPTAEVFDKVFGDVTPDLFPDLQVVGDFFVNSAMMMYEMGLFDKIAIKLEADRLEVLATLTPAEMAEYKKKLPVIVQEPFTADKVRKMYATRALSLLAFATLAETIDEEVKKAIKDDQTDDKPDRYVN